MQALYRMPAQSISIMPGYLLANGTGWAAPLSLLPSAESRARWVAEAGVMRAPYSVTMVIRTGSEE
jgi:hypothetical protein